MLTVSVKTPLDLTRCLWFVGGNSCGHVENMRKKLHTQTAASHKFEIQGLLMGMCQWFCAFGKCNILTCVILMQRRKMPD